MDAAPLKARLIERLWEVVDRHDFALSATLTGSFVDSPTLAGLSDIDFVVVVDHLDRGRFETLQRDFQAALAPELARDGYDLFMNASLGPLKFNSPQLAVLHLMLYSQDAHVAHVINSPFTCLDWQRSRTFRKRSLAECYPVFGLQPRHFRDGRRSVRDYLRDFNDRTVSYRDLECDDAGYTEVKRSKPMTDRDRHEFAYHVIRFLMRNLLRLVRRGAVLPDDASLSEAYFEVFADGPRSAIDFLSRLSRKKKSLDFAVPLPDLDRELTAFVESFEAQFRAHFDDRAVRHVVFRHAPTEANLGPLRFQGRSDPPPASDAFEAAALIDTLRTLRPTTCFSSPLVRCRRTLEVIRRSCELPAEQTRDDLLEMNYGACEGLTVDAAKQRVPEMFSAWARGEDPCFPDGECSADVAARAARFVRESLQTATGPTATCTHNVVLRMLLGEALGVPHAQRHLLDIPHAAPITFVTSERFGFFAELSPEIERTIFRKFSLLTK